MELKLDPYFEGDHISDSEWWIFTLGTDLLKGKLPNDTREAYRICEQIYSEFLKSHYKNRYDSEYTCIEKFIEEEILIHYEETEVDTLHDDLGDLLSEINNKIEVIDDLYEKSFERCTREDAEFDVINMMDNVREIGKSCSHFKEVHSLHVERDDLDLQNELAELTGMEL
ncbi:MULTISPECIES: hypothetical protein [unclassified Breznakia]|uniref:hypothetical protein n=1 Tax=unclassified Breznakia TaxID=2623764 RepID=UPI0024749302|nr:MULTISPECIES: hypothetical protein [unclassified Breznakia]MDH6367372.1 hypothetical protein [Breznakia sp. PH1-1]MDH6403904.1 hypothetical protein [Breznakia sp. PF1-11]MDH6411613.1 hypothetical protein [Breznakia sp. PFB1-11]MDH6414539.1 hypothetical protein [Breznakia sp. PFB1-14]MDH6418645.1 hypothetical protein [Breznakia sp. PFB1-12]